MYERMQKKKRLETNPKGPPTFRDQRAKEGSAKEKGGRKSSEKQNMKKEMSTRTSTCSY